MTRATVKRLLPPVLLDGLRAVRDWYRPPEQISEKWFREWWELEPSLATHDDYMATTSHTQGMAMKVGDYYERT